MCQAKTFTAATLHCHICQQNQYFTHSHIRNNNYIEREREWSDPEEKCVSIHTHERSLQQVGPPQNLIHGWHGTKLGTFVLDLNNAHKAWEENHGHGASNGLHCSRTLPHFHLIQRLNNKISQWPNLHQQKKCHSTLHKKHQEQQLNHPFCPPQNNRYPLQLQLPKSLFFKKNKSKLPPQTHSHSFNKQSIQTSSQINRRKKTQTNKPPSHKLIPICHFAETEKMNKNPHQ